MKNKILSSIILILILLSSTFVYATDEQVEIPNKYDLRNEISIIPQRQLSSNSDKGPACYHYAKTKMIETYLQKTKGINYNLSEAYYGYCGESENTIFVLESDFPNQMFSQISNIEQKVESVKSKAVINNFKYLRGINKEDSTTVKSYIQKYGGVLATLEGDVQWSDYKGGIYHKEKYTGNLHAVTIIGWDDNYSKDNFVYEKPENDGAWLILNTWGTSWGNNGTGWVSYEDSYNLLGGTEFIGSITLADGEVIETKLEDEKEETTETPVIEQQNQTQKMIEEHNNIKNMQNIFIITVAVIIILLITLIIIKHNNQSNSKDNNSKKKSKLKMVIIIELILIVLAMIFML